MQYSVLNHTNTGGNYTIPVENIVKTLKLADGNMFHNTVAKGLDAKYRINGDILRCLAVVGSGLTAGELLGTARPNRESRVYDAS